MSDEMITGEDVASRFSVGAEYSVPFGTILERRTFPSFALTKTSRGILFETYTGYHVWSTPYVTDQSGVLRAKSLHAWLSLLLEVASKCDESADELYPGLPVGDSMTYGDLLAVLRIVTETNLLHPVTAFVDEKRAADFSTSYMDWLKERASELERAMSSISRGDDAEMRASALMEREVEVREIMGGLADAVV